jgi:hypothetical protein
LMALVNGQLMAVVNGQLMALVNGQLMALVNGELEFATEVSMVNGQLMAVVNGQLMALVNGQLMAMVNGEMVTVSSTSVVNGQLMAVVNGQLMALVNGQLMALVNGQLMALVNNYGLGDDGSNENTAVITDEDDVTVQAGAVGGMVAVNMITGLDVGVQKLVPGTFMDDNYEVTYGLGDVTINPASLTISVQDTSRLCGQANPSFTITASGFVNGDDASDITMPVASADANAGSPSGNYPITLSGGSATNYQLSLLNGVLSISCYPLSVNADVKAVDQGSPLPVFTSTITGLMNNDVITGISYSASNVNTSVPGEYTNMPSLNTSLYPQYDITLQAAKFYVNPAGKNAKKIIVQRFCVSAITPVDGYSYKATFAYTNPNMTPVYISKGANNFITIDAGGAYKNDLPEVFLPGTHQVEILFNGKPMYWSVKNLSTFHKTAITSSNQAPEGCGVITFTVKGITEADKIPEAKAIGLYPNPAKNEVMVDLAEPLITGSEIILMDASGGMKNPLVNKRSASQIKLDVSGLQKGVYFIRLQSKSGMKILRFVKI